MKHFFTGITALATSFAGYAQPDCSQIIQASFTSGVQGNVVVFTSTSQSMFPQATTYQWYFGDGGSTGGNTVTHIYDQPGTYQVCLYAVVENCVDTVCHELTIEGGDPCLALADVVTTLVPQQGGVSFAYDNVPTYANIMWYFGDGAVSDAAQGFHQYQEPGTYNVCLWTWFIIDGTSDTCSSETCHPVTISGTDPCAGLQAGFTALMQGNMAQFSNSTTGTGFQTTWHWDFGDGSIGDGPQPSHTYPEPGTYLACLTAVSIYEQQGGGVITCADTVCHEVVIQGGGSPCDGLNPYFDVSVQGTMAMFDNAVSSNEYSYLWNFGDGTEGYGPDPMHTYPGPGAYHTCLTVWAWDPFTQDTCFADFCAWTMITGDGPCDTVQACFDWSGEGTTLLFDNCSSINGMGPWYQWNFGDGSQSDAISPSHTFPGPGTYTVCLTGWLPNSPDSCSSTVCHDVVIQGGGSPCDSLSAYFVVTTQENLAAFSSFGGSALGYQWNFGDGTSGDGPAPTHIYPGPGTYHACLVTWTWNPFTQDTCYADHCEWVTIGQGNPCDSLQACFQWGGENSVVQFYNCSYGGQDLIYMWHFGDGTMSDAFAPLHTFPEPGTYTVCLTVSLPNTPDSCSSAICNVVVVDGGGSPCDSLSAEFWWQQSGGPTNIVYSANTGNADHWLWTFGDGSASDNGPQGTHEYAEPGTYQICLTAWYAIPGTQDTCSASSCQWITVGVPEPCDSLQAGFQATVGDATVWFSNTTIGTGSQTTWHWDFGDGTTSDDAQPSHIFPGLDTYEVCLTATTLFEQQGGGFITCQDTYCSLVITGGGSPCDSAYEASFQWTAQGNSTIGFFGFTTPASTGYHWNFGDGTQGDGMNPVHTYPEPGEYHACLSAWYWNQGTQDTCWAEHCQWIYVNSDSPCDSLEAHFVWEPAGPNAFQFQDASFTNGQDVSYMWSFGDGQFSDDGSPVHTFAEPGQYQVCLTITALNSPDSCSSTTCQIITVQGGGSPCDGLTAEFASTVTGYSVAVQAGFNPPGTTFEWHFGDGTLGDGPNNTHTYPGPGTYSLCLLVGNYDAVTQDSCFEDHCVSITLLPSGNPCDSLWMASFEFGHQGNVYTFYNTSDTQGSEVSTQWTFGDGTSGDGSQLVHTYASSGNYTVCMTITGIAPGTNDTCQVEICQNIEVSVGIEDRTGTSPINAWPQPFDGTLQVEGAGLSGNTRCTLLDMTGRIIDDRSALSQGRMTLEYAGLPTGTYVLRLRNAIMDRSLRVVNR